MTIMSPTEWDVYCKKCDALMKRGPQVGDILLCDEGARPKPHHVTGKLCVRVRLLAIIEGPEPRLFVNGFKHGMVAYVPQFDEARPIPAGTRLKVVARSTSSCVLEKAD